MKEAADRTIKNCLVMTPDLVDVEPDGTQVARVAVTLDGTWQKRGHSSKHGVVFLIAVDSREVLDYCVKTIYCHESTIHQNDDKNSEKYKDWYVNHKNSCSINHHGSSGAMEARASVEMFLRSIETRNQKYMTFVGDGDSSCCGKVRDACYQRYGDVYPVLKEECNGHVQKRMGSVDYVNINVK